MIDTFFSLGQLDSSKALFMSLVIGVFFGIALERAGFGSSRRLAGVFYFKDMAVIKVMFTAMITAIIGISLSLHFGFVTQASIYLNPTLYSAQIVGGILFGIGFVMGGWCPGTAAVGAASGKGDALVFLGGTLAGSILFNETYTWIQRLYDTGNAHTAFIYQSLGISKEWFILLFILMGVLMFWGSEWIEKRVTKQSRYLHTDFLKQFSFVIMIVGFAVFILVGNPSSVGNPEMASPQALSDASEISEQLLLTQVDNALDHMDPEELAQRLMAGQQDLVLVDVRTEPEFLTFHIKTARHIPLKDLAKHLEPHRNQGTIVLYSNGMTHPAQARDSLFRMGFNNVYLLTDGLDGFIRHCLTPVSLRAEPIPVSHAKEINQWRQFFLPSAPDKGGIDGIKPSATTGLHLPGIMDAQGLLARLKSTGLRVIDLRNQPEYNTSHIPGSLALNVESFRGNIQGTPSCLLPAHLLSGHLSLMGIQPETLVVLVYGEKVQDATLVGMGLERLGHTNYAVLAGGHMGWKTLGLSTDAMLPEIPVSSYPAADKDQFTIDYKILLSHMQNKTALIIDVRPQAYYTGEKSDEARPGHIPGAINRPFDLDTVKTPDSLTFKPVSELKTAYEQIIPSKETQIILHCRTGHQASQTFFVLKHLLGYNRLLWYDAGWTEWAARLELPVKSGIDP